MRLRLLIALGLTLAATAPVAQANYAGGNGKIVFAEDVYPGELGATIATVNADGTGYQSLGPGRTPTWSPDGEHIAFTTPQRAVAVMNRDGSGRRSLTDRQTSGAPTWSPDGQQLALFFESCDCIALTRVDGSESRMVYRGNRTVVGDVCGVADLEWAPAGNTIAFSGRPCNAAQTGDDPEIYTVHADGTGLTKLTDEAGLATDPEWSPDGERIAYGLDEGASESIVSIRADGTDRTTIYSQGHDPTWAPDLSEVAFVARMAGGFDWRIFARRTNHDSIREIHRSESVKLDLDWQQVDPGFTGHARPKAASPAEFTLVPAYYPCEDPNRTHGPALAFPSCNPPVPRSDYLTVGTADANGNPPKFMGNLRYVAMPGNASTAEDEADVRVETSLTDVRCRVAGPACTAGALSDFSGKLRLMFEVRITDKHNALDHSITMQFTSFTVDVPCAVTPASPDGSTCGTTTTLDSIVPGVVPERKRSIWQLDQIVFYDGGPNGDFSAGVTTPFAVPGLFVP
jgi:WD40 repeat protein